MSSPSSRKAPTETELQNFFGLAWRRSFEPVAGFLQSGPFMRPVVEILLAQIFFQLMESLRGGKVHKTVQEAPILGPRMAHLMSQVSAHSLSPSVRVRFKNVVEKLRPIPRWCLPGSTKIVRFRRAERASEGCDSHQRIGGAPRVSLDQREAF